MDLQLTVTIYRHGVAVIPCSGPVVDLNLQNGGSTSPPTFKTEKQNCSHHF